MLIELLSCVLLIDGGKTSVIGRETFIARNPLRSFFWKIEEGFQIVAQTDPQFWSVFRGDRGRTQSGDTPPLLGPSLGLALASNQWDASVRWVTRVL